MRRFCHPCCSETANIAEMRAQREAIFAVSETCSVSAMITSFSSSTAIVRASHHVFVMFIAEASRRAWHAYSWICALRSGSTMRVTRWSHRLHFITSRGARRSAPSSSPRAPAAAAAAAAASADEDGDSQLQRTLPLRTSGTGPMALPRCHAHILSNAAPSSRDAESEALASSVRELCRHVWSAWYRSGIASSCVGVEIECGSGGERGGPRAPCPIRSRIRLSIVRATLKGEEGADSMAAGGGGSCTGYRDVSDVARWQFQFSSGIFEKVSEVNFN